MEVPPGSMRKSTQQFPLITGLAAAACVAVGGVAFAEEGVVFNLAGDATEIFAPRIASQGHFTSAVWVEKQRDGSTVLRQANLRDGFLTSKRGVVPLTITLAEAGRPSDPVVAFCPLTQRPGLSYVLTTEAGAAVVFRSPLGETQTIHRSTSLLELPVLDFDEAGRPYLAWEEIDGGRSRIMAATPAQDAWNVKAISEGNRPYDVYPQMFAGEHSADLHWFSIEGTGVRARSRSLTAEGFDGPALLNIPLIPENRLPGLYSVESGTTLGAWWLEQADRGEYYFALKPGQAEPVALGNPENLVEMPTASTDGAGVMAWLERTPEGDRLLAVDAGDGPDRFAVDRSATEPAVSRSEYHAHLLWVETPLDGESARLLYRRTR